MAGDLNGNGLEEVIVGFRATGLWTWDFNYGNPGWVKRHGFLPETIVTGDLDGNGQDEMIVDFGPGFGLWVWTNNRFWVKRHGLSPELMVTGDLNGGGQDELIVSFGPGFGLWVWTDNRFWVKRHGLSPELMVTGELHIGGTLEELIVDFGPGMGLWVWTSNRFWVKRHGWSPESMVTGDLNGNGQDEVIVDFGPGKGLWIWTNNRFWVKRHGWSPELMVTGDLDSCCPLHIELTVDFGPGKGLWVWADNRTWVKLHNISPEVMANSEKKKHRDYFIGVAIEPVNQNAGSVISVPAGINCPGNCAKIFNTKTVKQVTLTARPNAGWTFVGWSVGPIGTCPGTGTCTVKGEWGDVGVVAKFAKTTTTTTTTTTQLTFRGPVNPLPEGTVDVFYNKVSFCSPAPSTNKCGDPFNNPRTTDPSGGAPPYTFKLGSGVGFPPFGITLNTFTGRLSGTPTAAGTRDFGVCAVDLVGTNVCHNYKLKINPSPPPPEDCITGNYTGDFDGTAFSSFANAVLPIGANLSVSVNSNCNISVTSPNPDGISISGQGSGTISASGTWVFNFEFTPGGSFEFSELNGTFRSTGNTSGSVVSGTWSGTMTDGGTGSGSWSVSKN